MVLWCKTCGALMGLREPLTDWTVDRTGVCPTCAKSQLVSLALPKDEGGEAAGPAAETVVEKAKTPQGEEKSQPIK